MTIEEKKELEEFLNNNFEKMRSVNREHNSYRLKHYFENHLGFYISHENMIDAFLSTGFNKTNRGDQHVCFFNISNKDIKSVFGENPVGS